MKTIPTTNPDLPSLPSAAPTEPPHLCVGLDWGELEHTFIWQDRAGQTHEGSFAHSAENLHQWLKSLEQLAGGRPVRLALETNHSPVVAAMLQYPWLEIYAVNPVTTARYRSAFCPSGAKDDLPDAKVLLELVRDHADKLRPLHQPDSQTLKLAGLTEARRELVEECKKLINRLSSLLKSSFPQALLLVENLNTKLAIALLRRWPDLIALKSARSATIKRFYYKHQIRSQTLVAARLDVIAKAVALTTDEARLSVARLRMAALLDELELLHEHIGRFDAEIKTAFAAHPEADLFRNLPGAGPQLAPRLCAAFGTDRCVYPEPASLQKYAGLAPVREKSGNQLWVHWRWRAPVFLRQSFVEWAGQTVRYSAWAGVYYRHMLKKGKRHAAILRALAFKWIRILWTCWYHRVPYNEERYLKQLILRKSPNAVTP